MVVHPPVSTGGKISTDTCILSGDRAIPVIAGGSGRVVVLDSTKGSEGRDSPTQFLATAVTSYVSFGDSSDTCKIVGLEPTSLVNAVRQWHAPCSTQAPHSTYTTNTCKPMSVG
jgi:hypothetical protein